MNVTVFATVVLVILLGLLLAVTIFFLIEEPLHRRFIRWSDRRQAKRKE